MSIRVLLVDDDANVRESLRIIVDAEADLSVVAEAASAARAVSLARRLRVDVAVVDIHMPTSSGIEATAELTALEQAPRVLILTSFTSEENVVAALAAGATGFLLKALRPGELPAAIRATHGGTQVLAQPALSTIISRAVDAHRVEMSASDSEDLADLTRRERELMRAVGLGLSNSQIAAEMTLSEASVKTYVSRLLDKLGYANRTQLAIAAFRAGLLR